MEKPFRAEIASSSVPQWVLGREGSGRNIKVDADEAFKHSIL